MYPKTSTGSLSSKKFQPAACAPCQKLGTNSLFCFSVYFGFVTNFRESVCSGPSVPCVCVLVQQVKIHAPCLKLFGTNFLHVCGVCYSFSFTIWVQGRHCNTLQYAATYCNTLQYSTATHCNALQHAATHCNTLQHTATHCNTLQHTATHCNTLQHTATHFNATCEVVLVRRLSHVRQFVGLFSCLRRFRFECT